MASKTILAEVEGFTPVIDILVPDVGLMTAVVFGKVWRFCQMEDGVCYASLERMATELGIKRSTVMRHIRVLIQSGYLADVTPNLTDIEKSDPKARRRTRTYADTGKVMLEIKVQAAVVQKNKSVAVGNKPVAQKNKSVAVGATKIEARDEGKKEKKTATSTPVVAAVSSLPSEEFVQVHKLLQAAGVSEPTRTELAKLPNSTPEFVQAHIRAFEAEKQAAKGTGKPVPVGRLVNRIRANDAAPDVAAELGNDDGLTPRQRAAQRDLSRSGYRNVSRERMGMLAGGPEIERKIAPAGVVPADWKRA